MKFKFLILFLGFIFWSFSAHSKTFFPAGTLDSSYGIDGVANIEIGTPIRMNAAVLQSDDKIVIGGSSLLGGKLHFALARYTKEGKIDSSFGQSGIVLLDASKQGNFNLKGEDSIQAIKIQGDKIVVAGFITNSKNDRDLAIARFNAAGSLDMTFASDTGGIASYKEEGTDEVVNAFDFQEDGSLVVNILKDSEEVIQIGRFNSQGKLDMTFADKGFFGYDDRPNFLFNIKTIKIQKNNNKDKILIGGSIHSNQRTNGFIARIKPDGTDFDGQMLTLDLDKNGTDNEITSLLLQPDGKILMGGSSKEDFILSRCSENCDVGTEFIQKTDIENQNSDHLESIALQSDGKIIAVGLISKGFLQTAPVLVRYNSDGSLDSTFGGAGKVIRRFDTASFWKAVLIQSDGKIVVAGDISLTKPDEHFIIARYLDKPMEGISEENPSPAPADPNPAPKPKEDNSNPSHVNQGGGGCAIASIHSFHSGFLMFLILPLFYFRLRRKISFVRGNK